MLSRTLHKMTTMSLLSMILLIFLILPARSIPLLISYQGRLTDTSGKPVPDASYSFNFTIFADSTGEISLWTETTDLNTTDGIFTHYMGSQTPLSPEIFENNDSLFLEVTANGETFAPRTRFSSTPFSLVSANLDVRDKSGNKAVKSFAEDHKLVIYDTLGNESIILHGATSDSSVEFPDSAINADEMLNEPGITYNYEFNQKPLNTGEMSDLLTIDITIPDAGYIVVHGKCYVLLSGTTGANTVQIQIDDEEGGDPLFPHYTMAGLGGYVNTETNYFPIYVIRVFYEIAGTYTYRMEGRANYPPPADALSWDHVICAVYYPTSYDAVNFISPFPIEHPKANPVIINNAYDSTRNGVYYEIDLRHLEKKN